MSHKNFIEQEVLHEIAMSIGASLELGKMLKECLPVFVRGLGCCTAVILLKDNDCDFFTPRVILPHAAMRNQILHRAMAQAIEQSISATPLSVPLDIKDSRYFYYAWPLQDLGLLLLGRGSELPYHLYKEISPLAEKLTFAIQACLQYQSINEAREAMCKARDEAEAANKAKSHFLATISHEIRTPLNAVINLSELLQDTPLSDKQSALLKGVCEGGRSLLHLVNDVLDFSKIEAGKLELAVAPFHLRSLLMGLKDLYGKQAQAKALRFELLIAPEIPEVVQTDASRLQQVLQNLLANAIKFTSSGYVRLLVTLEMEFEHTNLHFVVEDTGIGIEETQQRKLFTEFQQADPGLNRHYGGTGLGLAIVARLVTLMKGRFGVDSTPGTGSRFWFSLPITTAGLLATSVPMSKQQLHFNGDLLLVEDSPTNQMVATALLERVGCNITLANSGSEALELVVQRDFDLVLMDISMPDMDGLETTRRIRKMGGKYSQLPIVAMTAHAFAQDRMSCLNAGMNDYLSKPLQRAQLYEMLQCWLPQPEDESSSALPEGLLEHKVLDELESQTSGAGFMRIIELFIDEIKEYAVQLEALCREQAWSRLPKTAHAIKSCTGAMGAVALHDSAAQLEILSRQALLSDYTKECEATMQLIRQTVMLFGEYAKKQSLYRQDPLMR